ncbi:MAG: protein kinase [Nannocystaceae bacterium]
MTPSAPRETTAPHYSTLPKDREARLIPGTRLEGGRLEILEELARGGMAVVYRAMDHDDGEEVALKVATADADRAQTSERFRNEARLGESLAGHPNVVRSLRVGHLDGPAGFEGRMYLVTELVDGVSLDIVMGQHHTGLPVQRACTIARDVARALVGVHGRGIVHRDVKPGNVVVGGHDEGERARLIDFGLAYATGDGWESKSPDLTAQGHAPGTPLYMSPQQAAHARPTPAFDVYSFGVMLYELFSGSPPYEGCALGVLLARKCDPEGVPFPIAKMCPDVPASVADIVDRCLLFDPSDRPDAAEILAALTEVVDGVSPAPSRRGWRRRFLIPAGVLMMALLVVGIASWPSDSNGVQARTDTRETTPPTSATYAKVGRVDGATTEHDAAAEAASSPRVARADARPATKAVEHAPAQPKPSTQDPPSPRRVPAKAVSSPSKPAVHKGAQAPVACDERRRRATDAQATKKWSNVLAQTEDPTCWNKSDRTRLRVEALVRLRRFRACARAAAGSTDPVVEQWGQECILGLMGGGQ